MFLEKIEENQMIQLTEEKRRTARKSSASSSLIPKVKQFVQKMKEKNLLQNCNDKKNDRN